MPSVVVLAMAGDARAPGSFAQVLDRFQCLLHFALHAHDAYQVLHRFLQVVLDLVRILARGAVVERRERGCGGVLHLGFIDLRCAILAREFGSILAGALAEDQQVGERIAAQAIGAVQARSCFARRKQPR